MKRTQPLLRGSLLSALITAVSACAPAHMAIPRDVGAASDEIVISDRSGMSGMLADESFTMGPYKIVSVDRKHNSSSTTSVAGFSSGDAQGGYAFGFRATEGSYAGQCTSLLDEKSVGLLGGTFGQQNFKVLCECVGPGKASLSMSSDTTSHYRGTVSAHGASYVVEGIYTDEKGSSISRPLGYHLHGSNPVGAVEVLGKGRVWLSRALDTSTRAETACLFAGLLLYQAPQGKMDK